MASKHRFCVSSLRRCQCSDLEMHRHVVNEKNRRDGFAEATRGPRQPSDFYRCGFIKTAQTASGCALITPRFHDDRLLWFSAPLWSGCERTLLFK